MNSKSRYQFISLLYELLLFFISSFILFPSHIKRIILCFVYFEDYQPSFINPSLEEGLQPPCVVDVNSISLPQPIPKEEFCIQIPSKFEHPCNLEEVELVSKPIHIAKPFTLIVDPGY